MPKTALLIWKTLQSLLNLVGLRDAGGAPRSELLQVVFWLRAWSERLGRLLEAL